MRIALSCLFAVLSFHAAAYERCHLESRADGTSSCFIASWNVTYACIGPTKGGSVSCKTSNDEQIDCLLKEAKFREPKEVWCDSPAIAQSEAPQVTLINAPPRRLVAERKGADPQLPPPKSPVSSENCDAISQYGLKVRCLKRKAAIEGVVPYEDCNAIVTADQGTWDERFQQKRRQNCLDRQAGIDSPPPQKTTICSKIDNQMSICR